MLTPQDLSFVFDRLYSELLKDLDNQAEADTRLITAKTVLAEARDHILRNHASDPKALGNNEASRDAKIAEMTAEQIAEVNTATSLVQSAKLIFEKRRLLIDLNRYQLRCAELSCALRKCDLLIND